MNGIKISSPKSSENGLDKRFIHEEKVFNNTAQEVVVTTADRLELCLIKHQNVIKTRHSWITPLGLVLSLLASLVAADFKDTLGLKAEQWQSIFFVCLIISLIWLVHSIYQFFKYMNESKVEKLIFKIKTNQ